LFRANRDQDLVNVVVTFNPCQKKVPVLNDSVASSSGSSCDISDNMSKEGKTDDKGPVHCKFHDKRLGFPENDNVLNVPLIACLLMFCEH